MADFDDRIFQRITELVFLLSQLDEEITIRKIAEVTESSLEQTREDVVLLDRYGIQVIPAEAVSHLGKYETRFDDTPLMLMDDAVEDLSHCSGLLFLNPVERSLLSKNTIDELKVKDTPLSVSHDVQTRAAVIEEAIQRNRLIRFRYRRANSPASELIITDPRYLFFNVTDSLYYCISFRNDEIVAFRLDRMLFSVHIEKESCPPVEPDDSRIQKLTYVWGSAFSSEEEPMHVLLRIEAGTANLLNKIKADTERRVHGHLYQKDNYWYYEDEVIGMASIRRWLMGYGSAIKVLEPLSVASELKTSSEMRLKCNESGTFYDV